MIYMKKRSFGIMLAIFALIIIGMGAYLIATRTTSENYENSAKTNYMHAFGEVVAAVNDLDENLEKGSYATGEPMSRALAAQIYGDCRAITMTMAVLPFASQELEQTSGFVGRVGDYAASLCRTSAENGGFTEEERQSLSKLSAIAAGFADSLNELQAGIESGEVFMDDPENAIHTARLKYKNYDTLSSVLLENESEFPPQEELKYDGRYSQSQTKSQQGELVTQSVARKTAADFLNLTEDKLTLSYTSQGNAICYYFTVNTGAGEADIVVTGDGRVKSFSSARVVYGGELSVDEAVANAKRFLDTRGYSGMELLKATNEGGLIACEFAPGQNGARLESEKIRIAIASDNGGLYAFDATAYLSAAATPPPANMLSAEQAAKAVPASLTSGQGSLSVISSPGGREIYCYVFRCENQAGNPITIYVNAVTGLQQEIIIG